MNNDDNKVDRRQLISNKVYRTSSGFALAMSLVIDDYELSNKVVIDNYELGIFISTHTVDVLLGILGF